MEQILTFRLICPFWTSFRNPSTINVHITYPFPPFTTIYGFLNAARGYPQDWSMDRDQWKISLMIESKGKLVETFSKIMKVYEDKSFGEQREQRKLSSSKGFFDRTTLIRQKLVGACYIIYLKSNSDLVLKAQQALMNPNWPLYLGESDDLVDVVHPHIISESPKFAQCIHSIMPGIVEGCRLIRIPVKFCEAGKRWTVEYGIYSLPPDNEGIQLSKPIEAYSIEGRNIVFYDNTGKTKPDIIRTSE